MDRVIDGVSGLGQRDVTQVILLDLRLVAQHVMQDVLLYQLKLLKICKCMGQWNQIAIVKAVPAQASCQQVSASYAQSFTADVHPSGGALVRSNHFRRYQGSHAV